MAAVDRSETGDPLRAVDSVALQHQQKGACRRQDRSLGDRPGPEERPRPGSEGLDPLRRPGTERQASDAADRALRGNEPIELRIFIDRSVVEVFANGRQYLALRVSPGREDSLGVALRAVGNDATLKSLDAWQMKRIYQ